MDNLNDMKIALNSVYGMPSDVIASPSVSIKDDGVYVKLDNMNNELKRYCENDVKEVYNTYNLFHNCNTFKSKNKDFIKKIIFNPPATIVFWADNVKTVVKAQSGEPYRPEIGVMAAISKRFFGNTGKFNTIINSCCRSYWMGEHSYENK